MIDLTIEVRVTHLYGEYRSKIARRILTMMKAEKMQPQTAPSSTDMNLNTEYSNFG